MGGAKSRPLYPPYADVIAVTGANRGTHIALAAPGVLLPAPEAAYQVATGNVPLLRLR
jgi:hypothetical protein